MTKYSSNYIGRRSAENLMHARRYAEEAGYPLNYMFSINWNLVGVNSLESTAMFKEVKKRVLRAWRYKMRDLPENTRALRHLEVQENPYSIPNTHWLMHLPSSDHANWIEFVILQRLSKLISQTVPEEAVHHEYVKHSGGVLKYINKGINPAYADYLHLKHVDQGNVVGPRTATSRNLGPAARKKAKWRRKRRLQIAKFN